MREAPAFCVSRTEAATFIMASNASFGMSGTAAATTARSASGASHVADTTVNLSMRAAFCCRTPAYMPDESPPPALLPVAAKRNIGCGSITSPPFSGMTSGDPSSTPLRPAHTLGSSKSSSSNKNSPPFFMAMDRGP